MAVLDAVGLGKPQVSIDVGTNVVGVVMDGVQARREVSSQRRIAGAR